MRALPSPRRVVVTGVGVVAPSGMNGAQRFWQGLLTPHEPARERPVQDDFGLDQWLDRRDAKRLDRFAHFAVAAAGEALEDAGLGGIGRDGDALGDVSPYDATRAAVVVGTGMGGLPAFEANVTARLERGERRVSPFTIPMTMANSPAGAVSLRWGLRGACECVATACAAGTHAIAAAARAVAYGNADLAVAGGAEACISPTAVAGFANMTALSKTGVSRPFDIARDGFCIGEGAAVLVLEPLEEAMGRGVTPYMEVLGAASTADAHHVTAPHPEGAGAVACMRAALADAEVDPREVVHVNAHGTSTPLNDAAEATAVRAVLAGGRPAVTSIKGVTGHPLGAAGAIEAVSVALSMRHRLLPPTAGTQDVDPSSGVDVVTEARPWTPGVTLSNSFGFGGHNGTLVLGPVPAAG